MKFIFAGLCALLLAVNGYAWLPLPASLQEGGDLAIQPRVELGSCGQSKVVYEGDKIVGGRDALQGELPWQISLQKKSWWSSSYSHICGGSVLNSRYVITAAHCVDGGNAGDFQVVTGAHNLKQVASKQRSHKVKRIVAHEQYNSRNIYNDIAILELSTPIDIDGAEGFVNGVCLPAPLEGTDGIVTASGWGAIREGGAAASVLQAVDLPVVTPEKCRSQYGESAIADSMICAGVDAGGKDSCQGDSGGPLVKRENGKATLVGVVSWGYGCARPGYAGVYTEVSHFVSWIQKNAV